MTLQPAGKKWLTACAMALCFDGSAMAQEIHPHAYVEQYVFHIAISDTSNSIDGLAELRLQLPDCYQDSLRLDLTAAGSTGGMQVSSISSRHHALGFRQDSQTLLIAAPEKGFPKKAFTLRIQYRGIPKDGLIISKNKYQQRTFFGDNWPNRAHNWLPLFDVPYIKAPVDFYISAPSHYQVIANGRLMSSVDISRNFRRTHWREQRPIAPKIMVFAAAPFAVHYWQDSDRKIPVETWVYPRDATAGAIDFRRADTILRYFENLLGAFPFEKCAHVESTTRYGGMENASNIFYDEKEVNGSGRLEGIMAHELAHQWFGDMVTERDWHHIWLSEGLASFMETVYTGHFWGKDSLNRELMRDQQTIFAFTKRHPGSIVDSSISNLNALLNPYTYQKASLMLRSLKQWIGASAFWQGLRLYLNRYKDGCALSRNFESCMERSSHRNLHPFFHQWLYRKQDPVLTCNWSYTASTRLVQLTIQQLQKGSAFQLHPRLLIQDIHGVRQYRTLDMEEKTQSWNFRSSAVPKLLELDPFGNLLCHLPAER